MSHHDYCSGRDATIHALSYYTADLRPLPGLCISRVAGRPRRALHAHGPCQPRAAQCETMSLNASGAVECKAASMGGWSSEASHVVEDGPNAHCCNPLRGAVCSGVGRSHASAGVGGSEEASGGRAAQEGGGGKAEAGRQRREGGGDSLGHAQRDAQRSGEAGRPPLQPPRGRVDVEHELMRAAAPAARDQA